MASVLRFFELFIVVLPFLSRAIGYTFTHQARGPQCEHDDEHDEGENIGVMTTQNSPRENADIARTNGFNEASQNAPHNCTP